MAPRSFIPLLVTLITLVAGIRPVAAQDEPVAVPFKILLKANDFHSGATVTLSMENGWTQTVSDMAGGSSHFIHPALDVGKTHELTVSITGGNINPKIPSSPKLRFSTLPGHVFHVNGKERKSIGVSNGSIIKLRVLPALDSVSAPAGTATSLTTGQVKWGVSLGRDINGNSVGWLWLVGAGADATSDSWSIFDDPDRLHFEDLHENVFLRKQNGLKRQIGTREGLVDIITPGANGAQFELRYYHWESVQDGFRTSFDNLRTFIGQPYVTYRVYRDQPGHERLRIEKLVRNPATGTDTTAPIVRTEWTTLERHGAIADAFTWIATPWTVAGVTPPLRTREQWTPLPTGHQALIEAQRLVGTAYVTDLASRRDYTRPHLNLPRLLSASTSAPDTASAFTDYAHYHAEPSAIGSFGLPRMQQAASGAWTQIDYYEPDANDNDKDKKLGVVTTTYQPWLDHGLTGDPAISADPKPHIYLKSSYTYAEDKFEMLTRPLTVETRYVSPDLDRVLSSSSYTYSTKSPNSWPVITATKTDTDHASGHTVTSVRAYYREDDLTLLRRNQTYSETSPTGERVSYYRRMGNLTISGPEENPTFSFTENGSGKENCVRTITGYAHAVPGGELLTHYGSVNIEDIYVVPGRSILTNFHRNQYGQLVRQSVFIRVTGGWEILSWEHYFYNLNHQLVRTRNHLGDVHEIFYTGEFKTAEIDAAGTHTTHDYDDAGRLLRTTLKGHATPTPQPDIVTEFTYDAAGQVLEQRVLSPGYAEQLVTTRTYDAAGRPATEQPPGLGVATYAYDVGARTQTVNHPDGTYITQTAYLDGQPKSTMGSGTVPAFHTHGFESDGRRWSKMHTGSAASPRWQKKWQDGFGRTVRSERPGFAGQDNFVEENIYENGTGRLLRTTRTGMAATLYAYDAFNQPITALDINQNSLIDYAGPDRVSYSDSVAVFTEGAWWQSTSNHAYLTAGDATSTLLGTSLKRLTGFTGTLRSETRSIDVEGNVATSLAYVDRATRTATSEQFAPGVANPAVSISVNGLTVSSTAPDGLVSTPGYDALRRPVSAVDPRTGTYTTTYYPGTTLVHTQIDARNVTVATSTYDVLGRRIASTDADGKTSRVSYHPLGGVSRQWGDTAIPVSYGYDAYGQRVTQSTYRAGTSWNSASWPAATTGNADTTTWTYDEATGLLKKKTDATNRYVEYAYNVRGQPTHRYWARTVDGTPGGARVTATYAYDPVTADPISTTYNDGTPGTSLTFDRSGRPLTRTDAAGTRAYAYDAAQPWRFAGETLPAYFGGRVLTPQRNETTTATAGAWGPHTRGTVKGSQIGYALGSAADPTRDLRVLYHTANTGRLAGLQAYGPGGGHGGSGAFHYTYTANSRLVAGLHAPDAGAFTGYSLNRAYETKRDLLTSIETAWGTTAQVRYEYAYDDRARRTRAVQGGDAFEADYGDEVRTDYAYDDRGQLTAADAYLGADPQDTSRPLPGRRHAYGYDTMGNRTTSSHHSPDSTKTAGYRTNALNQYTDRDHKGVPYRGVARADAPVAVDGQLAARQERYFWDDVNFAADPAGRLFPLAAALAGAGTGGKDAVQLAYRFAFWPGATETFAYDADGNLTEDGTWTYKYDAENRLVQMERKGWTALPGAPPRQRLVFSYDYQGRRIGKTVYNLGTGTSDVQLQQDLRFIYDAWNLIAEIDATQPSLPLLRSYAWGLDLVGSLSASGGVGGLVQIWDHVNDKRYLPAYDGNGNLAALFDAQVATLAAAYEYSPYGEAIRTSGTAAIAQDNPFRFSTKYTDAETGLIYYGMRYYDAKNGRFINRDPIEERGGLNLYGFCGNDGINHYDVLGMSWFSKMWKKLKKWIAKNQWAAIVVGALTGIGAAWAWGGALASAVGAKTAFAVGASYGAVGGAVSGAVNAALSGGNFGDILKGAALGGLGGAITGGILGHVGSKLGWSNLRNAADNSFARYAISGPTVTLDPVTIVGIAPASGTISGGIAGGAFFGSVYGWDTYANRLAIGGDPIRLKEVSINLDNEGQTYIYDDFYGWYLQGSDPSVYIPGGSPIYDSTLDILNIFGVARALQTFPRMAAGAWRRLSYRPQGAQIQFGKVSNQVSHAFRHVDAAGLPRGAVQAAVENHLKTVASHIQVGKPFNQIIEVAGKRLQYTAFKLPNGTINVGRIHPVP